jgi:hypothetical protein
VNSAQPGPPFPYYRREKQAAISASKANDEHMVRHTVPEVPRVFVSFIGALGHRQERPPTLASSSSFIGPYTPSISTNLPPTHSRQASIHFERTVGHAVLSRWAVRCVGGSRGSAMEGFRIKRAAAGSAWSVETRSSA